jgi:ribosomal-protein-alanine N-acetyltransferase
MSNSAQFGFQSLECLRLGPEWQQSLADFFQILRQAEYDKYFHPHPLTADEAERLCQYTGKDLYYIMVASDKVVGYGMLRGWDEGYEIPSLGIAIHPRARGKGLGKALMYFLHVVARWRGSPKIRLTVDRDNVAAVSLYKELGYSFREGTHAEQLVGILDL